VLGETKGEVVGEEVSEGRGIGNGNSRTADGSQSAIIIEAANEKHVATSLTLPFCCCSSSSYPFPACHNFVFLFFSYIFS